MRKDLDAIVARLGAASSSGSVSPELVAELTGLLGSDEPELRKLAARVLADLDRAAAAPLPPPVDEPGAGRDELRALARRGPAARAELPRLLQLLDSDDQELRSHAAETIGAVAPGAAELLPRLLPALLQQPRLDLRARRFARGVAALGGAAAPALCKALETGGPTERALAVTALCVLFVDAPQPAALPLLLRAVADEQLGDARHYAVAALGALAESSEVVVQTLAKLLRDSDLRVAREAAVALARSRPAGVASLRRAWALRPNARPTVLKKLGWVLDDPARALPVLTLLFVDDGPELDPALRTRIKHCLAERPTTPVALLRRFARDEDSETRLSLAGNRGSPAEIFAVLAKDRNEEVRRLVADNPATPAALLATLAADDSNDVKSTLAENPSTPADALEALVKQKIPKIKRLVARHRNTPLKRLEALAGHKEPLVRCAVAGNPNLPYALLEQLSQDSMLELTEAVAKHPHAPPRVLEGLTRHRERRVRAALALNPALPDALFRELAQDPAPAVKRALAENPRTPPAILKTLASTGLERVHEALVNNPGTPASALAILALSGTVAIRLGVLGHASVPDDVVVSLAGDADPQVRATAALKMDPRHPSWADIDPSWAEFGDSPE